MPPFDDERAFEAFVRSLAGGGGGGSGLTVTTRNATGMTALAVAAGGADFVDTLTGNVTYSAPSGPTAGTKCLVDLTLIQDATGGRTVTWFSGITWLSGSTPVVPAAPASRLLVQLITMDGGATWFGAYGPVTAASSGILGVTEYAPGSTTTYTLTSTGADIDATNLVVTFTAPQSGRVLVTLETFANPQSTSSNFWWGLREGTTDLTYKRVTNGAQSASIVPLTFRRAFLITGLTPGSAHTYKWAGLDTTSNTSVYAGANTTSGIGGALMMVEAA